MKTQKKKQYQLIRKVDTLKTCGISFDFLYVRLYPDILTCLPKKALVEVKEDKKTLNTLTVEKILKTLKEFEL